MTQIDTSGAVQATNQDDDASRIVWDDLSPFTQGYIEALFASLPPKERAMTDGATVGIPRSFSDIAPKTLARIIADCEAGRAIFVKIGPSTLNAKGRQFWADRQDEMLRRFPPLTVQLGDDSKVRFAV